MTETGPVLGDRPQFRIVDQCYACRRRELDRPVCAAFPDGIPLEIILGRKDHLLPIEGDHGLQRIPTPPETANGPIRFFRVSRAPFGVVSAVWMSEDGQAIGVVPIEGQEGELQHWSGIFHEAWHADIEAERSVEDLFTYWWSAGNGVSWDTGAMERAENLQELYELMAPLPT